MPHKRPLVVLRGTFNHSELLDPALLRNAGLQLVAEGAQFEREPAALLEMTIRHVSCAATFSPTEPVRFVMSITAGAKVLRETFISIYQEPFWRVSADCLRRT